jgi:hypothetical protein
MVGREPGVVVASLLDLGLSSVILSGFEDIYRKLCSAPIGVFLTRTLPAKFLYPPESDKFPAQETTGHCRKQTVIIHSGRKINEGSKL